jgi:DNA modification methylase
MQFKVKKISLSEIKLNPDNPRTISKEQMERLVKSLKEFPEMMELREIVVDDNMMILGGNMRYLALKEAGENECIAKIVSDLTPEQKKEFIIKDNGSWGEWDMDVLANGWDDLPLTDWGVNLPDDWFKGEDIEPVDAEPQIDKAEELNKIWKVKTGDLWEIGEHRLLCGDSTKAEDVERVMGGEKADMIFTDPPYGINIVGKDGNIGGDTKQAPTTKFIKVIGDDKEFDPSFLIRFELPTFIWGGNYFAHLLPKGGRWFVWDKNRPEGLSLSDCELAWSNIKGVKVQKFKSTWDGYHVEGEKSGRIHPNQKPIKLISDILLEITKDYALLIDPFLGSGTTMVACQNLNRKCRGTEISENYCAVILQRMKDAFPDIEIRRIDERP